jgi:hypothetical protein
VSIDDSELDIDQEEMHDVIITDDLEHVVTSNKE